MPKLYLSTSTQRKKRRATKSVRLVIGSSSRSRRSSTGWKVKNKRYLSKATRRVAQKCKKLQTAISRFYLESLTSAEGVIFIRKPKSGWMQIEARNAATNKTYFKYLSARTADLYKAAAYIARLIKKGLKTKVTFKGQTDAFMDMVNMAAANTPTQPVTQTQGSTASYNYGSGSTASTGPSAQTNIGVSL